MEYTADIHVHSRYSRATSQNLTIEGLYHGAQRKGINIMGTGDFTHPSYFKEIKDGLVALGNGFYCFSEDDRNNPKMQFILTQEISSIYKRGGKTRRIHNLILAPSLEIVAKIIERLERIGNLKADGRPILGLDSEELLKIILDISEECMLIPAHIWTPWFSLFGSMSGFDSIEECFGDMSKHIFAVETGLSSDPLMNWMVNDLDNVAILSNGDAHSIPNLAREANVFELSEISYQNFISAIKNSRRFDANNRPKDYLKYTIEFYPEEGKYHFDGHRECNVVMDPHETKKHKGICPKCKKELTIGVMHRVHELAARSEDEAGKFGKAHKAPFKKLVPLQEIIANSYGVSKNSKRVLKMYEDILKHGNELAILINMDLCDIAEFSSPEIAEGVRRAREGKIYISPGFDGVYGKVEIFKDSGLTKKNVSQQSLF